MSPEVWAPATVRRSREGTAVLGRVLAGVLGIGLLLGSVPPVAASTPGSPVAPGKRTTSEQRGATRFSVTLLTGDRVSVPSADAKRITVRPARSRGHIQFVVRRERDSVYVVPSDAQPLVQTGGIDRRLFDVAGLLRAGYHDGARGTLPLIVTYRPGAARRGGDTLAAAGARVTRDLPAISGAAMTADKSDATAFWNAVTAGNRAQRGETAGGIDRIWLDGKRRVSLDTSVPQIGAPVAWQGGYTGRGVTVAVLDSGVDARHPDLAGRVADSVNFTDATDDGDVTGHGTHVASTIAGSGAASGGRYRGVAPEATLVSGKVCPGEFCDDSAILAGMHWAAADKRATVVNLSLGGPDTPEIDPIEEAVNRLTAEYGTLFVVAAGNSGADRAVSSPGSADAALTVGAVDRADQLAGFSNRGPRLDGAVKPDLTAPGVDIVAARAAGTELGTPVGDRYVTASGTSMATPHVAGSAVLLAQRRPGWTAERLKAALTGSARTNPDLTPDQQGAGRVDVAGAITHTVTSTPVSLGYGLAAWPHEDDAPVVRTVTYRNSGPNAVTLDLTVKAAGPDGSPAPTSLFTPASRSVTVPAGSDAEVAVVADTSVDGPDGRYSGYLFATAGSAVVSTPLWVEKEIESYDVTVTTIDKTGTPTGLSAPELFDLEQDVYEWPRDDDGTATIRVARGSYQVDAVIWTPRGPAEPEHDSAFLVRPIVTVDRDTTVVLDARTAEPVRTTVPDPTARPALVEVSYTRRHGGSSVFRGLLGATFEVLSSRQIGPAPAAPDFVGAVASQWALPGPDGTFADSPYLYAVAEPFPGRFPTGYTRRYTAGEFATVQQEFGPAGPGRGGVRQTTPEYGHGNGNLINEMPLPRSGRRVEFYSTDQVRWRSEILIGVPDDTGLIDPQLLLLQAPVTYRAGRVYRDRWNTGPYGVAFPEPEAPGEWVTRQGDRILVDIPFYGDGAGHAGFTVPDTTRTRLYRNGALVGENDTFDHSQFEVPAGRAEYRLELDLTQAVSDLTTQVTAEWTFRSGHVDGDVPARLPVSAVRFTPTLSAGNSAPAGRPFDIPVTVQRQPGAPHADVRRLTVDASYDDGRTWHRATIRNGTARLVHPNRPGYVSLRASTTDSAGNTTIQTLTHAYRIH
ncbi:S8 family peptidase [Plantactinospora sp. CA-294935]|uniref:S8 family peptidase n=1 Tax=Plantactinospora sp. CA-294935 TaxID=3240012 RepID=UPI003D8DC570